MEIIMLVFTAAFVMAIVKEFKIALYHVNQERQEEKLEALSTPFWLVGAQVVSYSFTAVVLINVWMHFNWLAALAYSVGLVFMSGSIRALLLPAKDSKFYRKALC